MTINLTGKNCHNEFNLTGKTKNINNYSYKIDNLKKYIVKNYIIPLYTEQWDILNKNKMLIDATILKINTYYKLYKLEELNLFLEIIKILKMVLDKNALIHDLESNNKIYDKNSIINMVYKTTRIQILPEYEIYNSIIGKPNMRQKEKYNQNIIEDIKTLLSRENITYDKINEYICKKYS